MIKILDYEINKFSPTFIIAEAGVNHNGDINLAEKLIHVAKEAGASAVKFQTFSADKLVSPSAGKALYQKETTDPSESQKEMLRKLELSPETHEKLIQICRTKEIIFLSTPFDYQSCDLLERLNVPAYKIGSGDLTNYPLLEYVGNKMKPVLLSTGMASISEVEAGIRALRKANLKDIALLHCVSCYPTFPEEVNLRAIKTLKKAFGLPVGFSDHTCGLIIGFAAVALGADIIEKHFTLDRNLPGPDHRMSLEPYELKDFIKGIREVEKALGNGRKEPCERELEIARVVRRSLYVTREITAGSVLTESDIVLKRPGTGLSPDMINIFIGKKVTRTIQEGESLSFNHILMA